VSGGSFDAACNITQYEWGYLDYRKVFTDAENELELEH
jgi:hypothetical protein